MNTVWLAHHEPNTFWARQCTLSFAEFAQQGTVALWPIHAFSVRKGLPLDLEERSASRLLRMVSVLGDQPLPLLTLPPWRFAPDISDDILFGLDTQTILDAWNEIAKGIHDSGIKKFVFFPTHPLCEPLCTTAAVDIRERYGLDTYVITTRGLGIDFSALAESATLQKAAIDLYRWIYEIHHHRTNAGVQPSCPVASREAPETESDLWPSFSERYLGNMNAPAIAAAKRRLAIIPVGSIEQHGPHLPVGVDALLSEVMVYEASKHLRPDSGIFIAPPITFGKSNEHNGFPGTLSISARTLRQQLLQLGKKLHLLGFERLAFVNAHGGNTSVLRSTVQELKHQLRCPVSLVRHGFRPDIDPHEAAWGLHGGEWETSLMLGCAPTWVHMDRAIAEYPVPREAQGRLRPERSPAVFGWLTKDISKSGIMGDPTRASQENGRLWLQQIGIHLARQLKELIA